MIGPFGRRRKLVTELTNSEVFTLRREATIFVRFSIVFLIINAVLSVILLPQPMEHIGDLKTLALVVALITTIPLVLVGTAHARLMTLCVRGEPIWFLRGSMAGILLALAGALFILTVSPEETHTIRLVSGGMILVFAGLTLIVGTAHARLLKLWKDLLSERRKAL